MTSETLERSRARILGDERVVVIEAAAGCGKTFEAVGGTTALAQQLEDGQEVLLLTHTNSARRVFEGRLSVAGTRATMQTLDSLAFEVVKRYAPHLGLEQPVVPDAVHRGHPSFKDIRGMARRLLESAPAVAEGLAWRHPVILVDEHQDSSDDQHAVVRRHRGEARHASSLLRRPAAVHLRLRWRRRRVGLAMRAAREGDARVRPTLE
jgi:DNA helicase-2/ATP-dependent DNA helicase PcrA